MATFLKTFESQRIGHYYDRPKMQKGITDMTMSSHRRDYIRKIKAGQIHSMKEGKR